MFFELAHLNLSCACHTGALGSGLNNNGNGLGGLGIGFGPNGTIHNGFNNMNPHGNSVGSGGGISVTGYGGSNGIGGVSSIGGPINGMGGNNAAIGNGQASKNDGTTDIAAKQLVSYWSYIYIHTSSFFRNVCVMKEKMQKKTKR